MRTLLLSLLLVLLLAPAAAAADKDAMQDAPVVRRAINWRAERSELMPQLGTTFNDQYFKNVILALGYNYHATNWLSFGANVGYAFPLKTSMSENIETEKSEKGSSFIMPATHLGLVADAHIGLVPFYGKMLLMGDTAVAYDFHATVGFGVLQVLWNEDLPSSFNAEDGFRSAPVFGGGFRVFVDRGVAINVEVLDYFATMHVVAERDPDQKASECKTRPLDCYRVPASMDWTHNVMALVSFSIMMPYDLSYEE